uniref:IRS-type PTB domain-containing protein n=1 Tax=Petromyzon marinus TaxID=7757 RepID=S4RZA9_PETMA
NEFWVSIHKTEASERCGLVGSYKLKGDQEDLTLKDPASGNAIYVWPYKLLRRFGRDKTSFTFEAGRRCNSGPGTFMFDTKNGNDIFNIIEKSINQTKLNRNSQNYTEGDTSTSKTKPLEEVAKLSLVKSSQNYDRRMAPPQSIVVKPFPISPSLPGMSPTAKSSSSAGSTPPRSPLPRPPLLDPCLARLESLQDVYADPADSLMLTIKHYHDPETENNHPCVTGKLRSNGLLAVAKQKESAPEPVYSDPYEKVEQKNTEASSSRRQGQTPEHIYDEPEGIEKPTASLYDEALQIKGDAWKVQAKPEHAYNEQPFPSPIDSFAAPLPALNPQKNQSMESPPLHSKNTEQAPQLPPKPRQMVAQKFGPKPPTTEVRGWNTANSNNSNSKL